MNWRSAVACALLVLLSTKAQAVTVLTLAHVMSVEHPRAKASLVFAERVGTLSQGRLQVEIHGNASLGDAATNLRALQNGTLDMAIASQGVAATVVPEFSAIGLPFLFPDAQTAWRVLDGPIGKRLAEAAESKGLVVLGYWDNGLRHFSNNQRPLLRPSDFSGLRFRTAPDQLSVELVEVLGGKALRINYSELNAALRLGAADGQENPLVNMREARLYEHQKYVSLTGHRYQTSPFLMAKGSWDGLSRADRNVLLVAAHEATRYLRAINQSEEREAHAAMLAAGVRVDKVDVKPFIAAAAPLYDKWYAGPIGAFVRAVVAAAREGI